MLLSMFWKAVCGESRTHGLEGAEEGRPSSATLQILEKNLQKGVDRWFEKDLQQRGRTQEEMQQMTLSHTREQERCFFMMAIDGYLNTAFSKLLQHTCKDLIQKWSQEGGKKDFAIDVILEMLKDRYQLQDEQALKTSLQNIDDWQTIKKLIGLAAFMEDWIFHSYTALIERVLNSEGHTREGITGDIRALIYLQFGDAAVEKIAPAIESIEDLQELKQVFIEGARALNFFTFRTALSALQSTEKVERSSSAQQ